MLKRILTTFILLSGVQAASAADVCSLPSVAATVPLKPVVNSNLLTAPVQINGKPKEFLLAISANPTQISQGAIIDLGLVKSVKYGQRMEYNMSLMAPGGEGGGATSVESLSVPMTDARSGRSADPVAQVDIDAFTIGGATGKGLKFDMSKDKELGHSKPWDGLLTGNFFSKYDVEMDFGGKQLVYLTHSECTDPGKLVFWSHGAVAVMPMSVLDGKMQVQVTIGDQVINAVIDTTLDRSVMRRDVAEELFGFRAGTPEMAQVADRKDGRGNPVYGHTFKQLSLEGVIAATVPVLIQANSDNKDLDRSPILGSRAQFTPEKIPALSLGMDVLSHLHLYVAYAQDKIYATAAK